MYVYILPKGVFFYKASTLKKQNFVHGTFEEGKVKRKKKRMVDLFGLMKKIQRRFDTYFHNLS